MTLEKVDIVPRILSLGKNGDEMMKARRKNLKPNLEGRVEFEGYDESKISPVHISIFSEDGVRKPRENVVLAGNVASTSWRNIVAVMSEYCKSDHAQVASKGDAMLITFWKFKDPYGRCVKATAAAMTVLVLDYDGLASYDEVRNSLVQSGLAFFMHSTFSSADHTALSKRCVYTCNYGKKGRDRPLDKFRVLIPLTREIETDEMTDYLRRVVQSDFPGIDRT